MWDGVNQKAINFIKRCLIKDYNQRPHADELLNDEWISEHNP
jgi:serine/threonine protein kinase